MQNLSLGGGQILQQEPLYEESKSESLGSDQGPRKNSIGSTGSSSNGPQPYLEMPNNLYKSDKLKKTQNLDGSILSVSTIRLGREMIDLHK